MSIKSVLAVLMLLALGSANSASAHDHRYQSDLTSNGVFALGNDASVNTVLAYKLVGGGLEPVGTFATGGQGGARGNQGGLALAQKRAALFAVNAGSDSLTHFDVHPNLLSLREVVPSHGEGPVSVATCTPAGSERSLVYVLNGTSRSIAGYQLAEDGSLEYLDGSVQALSEAESGAAQILFDNTCNVVIVVERNPDSFMLFPLDEDGVADAGVNVPSLSAGQLGSAITKENQLFVSETGTSAASSFALDVSEPAAWPISQTVTNDQRGSCWAVATHRGFSCDRYGRGCTVGYVMNAGTANITSYTIEESGELSVREVIAGDTFGGAFDGSLAGRDRFLVVQSRGDAEGRALNLFRIRPDGGLEFRQLVTGLPTSANSVIAAN